jgi:hypothetical protein
MNASLKPSSRSITRGERSCYEPYQLAITMIRVAAELLLRRVRHPPQPHNKSNLVRQPSKRSFVIYFFLIIDAGSRREGHRRSHVRLCDRFTSFSSCLAPTKAGAFNSAEYGNKITRVHQPDEDAKEKARLELQVC